MNTINSDRARRLLYEIRKQYEHGIHTYCACECGNPSRGGYCADCATSELGNLIEDHVLALEYQESAMRMAQATGAILEKIQ